MHSQHFKNVNFTSKITINEPWFSIVQRQAIICIINSLVYWCIYASPSLNKLRNTFHVTKLWTHWGQDKNGRHSPVLNTLRPRQNGRHSPVVNILRPRQNGPHSPDYIFKWIFLNENIWISINISLKFFVPKGPTNDIPSLVQVMAWPLSEPMMVSLLMHTCVTRPQWVNMDGHAKVFCVSL